MGHIKNEIERLEKLEQEGGGWAARKLGEIDLVRDAVPQKFHPQLDDIAAELEKPADKRKLTTVHTNLLHALHRDFAREALQASARYETAAERAEKAHETRKRTGVVTPDATQTDGGQTGKKRRARKS